MVTTDTQAPTPGSQALRRICLSFVDSAGFCRDTCPHLHPADLATHVALRAQQLRMGVTTAQGEGLGTLLLRGLPKPTHVRSQTLASLALATVTDLMRPMHGPRSCQEAPLRSSPRPPGPRVRRCAMHHQRHTSPPDR